MGELVDKHGKSWEFQLKGAGPGPYSRRADGRAVLRSSIREYLMSEAMYYLGVPSTRALSLMGTGDDVLRDMFYDGNPSYEPGAVVARVAPSFLRFGNFEILYSRGEIDLLRDLSDWTINKFFLEDISEETEKYISWFCAVRDKTIHMLCEWLRVGFVHGVMNTDNMSILGLSIDYGPFSMLDAYDPNFTPNTTDLPGRRYAFQKQASIAYWNLERFAVAISPLVKDQELLRKELSKTQEIFSSRYRDVLAKKLGLDVITSSDFEFVSSLFEKMYEYELDYNLFFYHWCEVVEGKKELKDLKELSYKDLKIEEAKEMDQFFSEFFLQWKARSQNFNQETIHKMKSMNPHFLLRNYLLQEAIEEMYEGNNEKFLLLEEAIKKPYAVDSKFLDLCKKRPAWAKDKAGSSSLSCSS